jgi:monothiol glutaredoxin
MKTAKETHSRHFSTKKNISEKNSSFFFLLLLQAWPTFPQVYIAGSFFGGCDIMIEAYQSGELVEVLETALSE